MTDERQAPPAIPAHDMEYRIVQLYRPQVGRLWWLQRGEWLPSNGAMMIATGQGRRTFRVEWEESYPTREAAETRLQAIERG